MIRGDQLVMDEISIMEGKILILPFGREDTIYHVFRKRSKNGKIFWTKREVLYESMVLSIAREGDNGMFVGSAKDADDLIERLKRTY